jgi:hypothetical protein
MKIGFCSMSEARPKERDIRTKSRLLSTGVIRGGILFGRSALYYVLSNPFYIGEVKYKNEILPGEQPRPTPGSRPTFD